MNWKVTRDEEILKVGHPADIKEFIQDLIEEEIGLYLDLQENEEEGFIYLHSEYVEDLTDADIKKVEDLGITEDWDRTTITAIEKLLNVKIDTPV